MSFFNIKNGATIVAPFFVGQMCAAAHADRDACCVAIRFDKHP